MIKSLFISLFLCTTSLGFGQTTLQYTLQKGDRFNIQQEAVQLIEQELAQGTHQISNSLQSQMEFRVTGIAENTYTILVSFKQLKIQMHSNVQGDLLHVDASELDEENPNSKVFHTLLEVPIRLQMSRTGDILKISGGDVLVEKMVNAAELEDEYSRLLMQSSLEKEFGSQALSNSFKQLTYFYPDKQVMVGDRWSNQYQGKLSARNEWVLKQLEPDNATIYGNAHIKLQIDQQEAPVQLEGQQETRVVTLRNSGFVRSMEVKSTTKGYSAPMGLGESPVPTTIKSTITYTLIQD